MTPPSLAAVLALSSAMLVTMPADAQSTPPPEPGGWPDAPPPPPTPEKKERAFEAFDGTHGFLGMGFKPGVALAYSHANGSASDAEFAFLWALRGGVLFDRTELALEVAPVTARPFWPSTDPSLSALVSLGTHLRLADRVSWPIRVGAGITAVNFLSDAAFQARLDAVGLSIDANHFLIDIQLPTFRYHTDFDAYGLFNLYFGVDAVYVF